MSELLRELNVQVVALSKSVKTLNRMLRAGFAFLILLLIALEMWLKGQAGKNKLLHLLNLGQISRFHSQGRL